MYFCLQLSQHKHTHTTLPLLMSLSLKWEERLPLEWRQSMQSHGQVSFPSTDLPARPALFPPMAPPLSLGRWRMAIRWRTLMKCLSSPLATLTCPLDGRSWLPRHAGQVGLSQIMNKAFRVLELALPEVPISVTSRFIDVNSHSTSYHLCCSYRCRPAPMVPCLQTVCWHASLHASSRTSLFLTPQPASKSSAACSASSLSGILPACRGFRQPAPAHLVS